MRLMKVLEKYLRGHERNIISTRIRKTMIRNFEFASKPGGINERVCYYDEMTYEPGEVRLLVKGY